MKTSVPPMILIDGFTAGGCALIGIDPDETTEAARERTALQPDFDARKAPPGETQNLQGLFPRAGPASGSG